MERLDIIPKPEANVPPNLQNVIQSNVEQQKEESKITLDDLLTRKTILLGDQEVSPNLVQKANAGDLKALGDLESSLRRYNKTVSDQVKIVSDDPRRYENLQDLTVDQKEKLKKYKDGRLVLLDLLKQTNTRTGKPRVQDERVQQLLVDYFSTGKFFTETSRRLAEAGRGFTLTPVLANMLYHVVGSATDAIDMPQFVADGISAVIGSKVYPDDETFAESWAKRQPTIANNFEFYKSKVEKLLPGLTFASGINDDLKEKYIEIYGKDDYERFYTLQAKGKKRIELPFITEEMGQDLLKLGFKELPFYSQAAIMVLENLGIGGAFAAGTRYKGAKEMQRIRNAKQMQPERYGNLTNLQTIRKLKVDESRNAFFRYLNEVKQSLGNRYKKFGAVDAAEVDENRTAAIEMLNKQIKSKQDDIAKAQNKKTVDRVEVASLRKELDNLESQRARYTFPFPRKTFMTEVFKDETIIGFGQHGGYVLADAFGLNTDGGEIFGAISTAVKVPQIIARNTVGLGLRFADKLGGGIVSNFATTVENLPFIPKGVFVDYRFENLRDILDRPLKGKEISAIKEISRVIKTLNPAMRERVWNSIDEYQRLRGRIINFFDDPDERALAKQYFSVGFARMSGLAPLIALEQNAIVKLKANGKNLNDAVDYQLQAENTLNAADLAISKLKELVLKSTKMDLDNREELTAIIKKFEAASDSYQLKIDEDKLTYLGILNEFKKQTLADPENQFFNDDMVKTLSEMEIKLNKGKTTSITEQRKIYEQNYIDLAKAIHEKGKTLIELSGDSQSVRKLGPIIEEAYLARADNIYHQKRLLYRENGLGDDRTFDITDLVNKVVETEKGVLDKATLKAYFSPESEFFRGFSGRNIKRSLNAMAQRVIKNDMGLDDDEYEKLFKYHTSSNTLKVAPDDYLGSPDEVSDIMIVLHAAKSQSEGGLDLKPFKASMFEIDELKRHFFKIGRRLELQKPELAKVYKDFSIESEKLLKSDPERYPKLTQIRRNYKILNFDPSRKDTLGDFIDNSRTGEPAYDETKRFDGNPIFPYKKGRDPSKWHKVLGENVTKYLKGDADALANIEENMEQIVRYWTAGEQLDGRMIFDLTTERGRLNLASLQTVVSATLYQHWGDLRNATLKDIKQTVELGGKPDELIKKYNFLDADNYKKLDNLLKIKVKGEDGKIETFKLVDLTQMLSQEQDIVKLIDKSKTAQKQLKDIETELNDQSSLLSQRAKTVIGLQNRGIKKLEEISGTADPVQFYQTFVLNGSASSVSTLRELYKISRKYENEKLKDKDIIEEFNSAFKYQITQGLLARAGMAPAENKTIQGIGNQNVRLTVMTNAAQLASDLSNPSTKAILKEIGFDDDQLMFMEDIGRFFEYAQGSSLVRYDIGGVIRGISPNEIISRTFNIARRMVSPLYVGTEIAARLAIMKGNELIAIGLQNKQAGQIIGKMLQNPADLTSDDIKTFGVILKEFIATELAREGGSISTYIPEEELLAAKDPVDPDALSVKTAIPKFIELFSQPRKKQTLEQLEEEDKEKENEEVQ